jgi:steroid delta-isomerase-like uncharacterized protein
MSVEENKAVVRRAFELLSGRDVEGLRKILAPDFVDHSPYPGQGAGIDGLLEVVRMWFQAFPDFRHSIDDQIAEGERVMTRYTWSGTHRGEMAGIAPTGKRVEVGGIEVFRIRNGKVTDVWRVEDNLRLMQQLGIVPEFTEGEAAAAG